MIKAKQARQPVLKKNWRPMNLGKSKRPLDSGTPRPGLRCPWAGGRMGSAITTHCAVGDIEALGGGEASSPSGLGVTIAWERGIHYAEGALGGEQKPRHPPCPVPDCLVDLASVPLPGSKGSEALPDNCSSGFPPNPRLPHQKKKRVPSRLFV